MTEKPQLCDISEPGLGVGSSTRSGSPWVPHRALDTNVHRRWKDDKRKLLASSARFGGKDT